jgi:hypothetical protein
MTLLNVDIIDDEADAIALSTDMTNEIISELNTNFQTLGVTIESRITPFTTVNDYKASLGERSPDIIIVDLAFGTAFDKSGWTIINEVTKREIIPVVVFSAHADDAIPGDEIYKNLLIIRQKKGEGNYKDILKNVIELKLNFILEKERVINEFGQISLETCKKLINETEIQRVDKNILSFLALTRLTSLLLNIPPKDGSKFPPESIFIYPPLIHKTVSKNCVMLGDILQCREEGDLKGLWFVCSPSCDLVFNDAGDRKHKVNDILLLPCYHNPTEIRSFTGKPIGSIKESLKTSLKNKTSKILKCPRKIFSSPYLLLYFKEYRTVPYDLIKTSLENNSWEKIASVATPYAESMQNLFIHDFSRIGTPDTTSDEEEQDWITNFLR